MQAGLAPRPIRPPRSRRPGGRTALVLTAAFALTWLAGARPAGAVVTFPGPRTVVLPQPGYSVQAVRLPGEVADDLLVGMDGGMLGLVHYTVSSTAVVTRQLLALDGRVVQLLPWEGLPLAEQGVVVATADPDRLLFVRIADHYPYLTLVHGVDLDEDPGTLAWFGDVPGGVGQVAVSLPGVDAIALVADQGGWHVRQTVAVGDGPYALTGADLDGDGVREVVAAQRGALSGNLAVLTADSGGQASVRIVAVPGLVPGLVCRVDGDGDGIDELAVADRDAPRVAFLRADGAAFAPDGGVDLSMPARQLTMWTLADGQPALLAGDVDRGAVELASRTTTGWASRGVYYPGCRPMAVAAVDLDGDGLIDIATVGAGGPVLALMFARPGPAFWGLPSMTLSALPGDLTHGDFTGDGRADIMVAAALEPRLSLFASLPDGGLATTAVEFDLGFSPGRLVALELDGDSVREIAVLDVIAGQVVILDAAAEGGFTELLRHDVGSYPVFLASGDIDADGLVDLLAVPSDGTRLQLMYGTPGGGFTAPAALTYEIGTVRAALVDLNGDGLLDIAGVDGSSRLWWRVNTGGRTFGPGLWLHAGNGASLIATGDLDGDLDADIVVGCRLDHSLVSYENNGAGGLVRRTGSYVLESEPGGLRIADFDNDGRGDVVVGLRDEDKLDIYLSIVPWNHLYALSVPATPEVQTFSVLDINLDGAVDLLALDSSLRMGVTHLNVDPESVALEPRSLEAGCTADGGLEVRLEPGWDGPWRLDARVDGGWRLLAQAEGAQAGRLEQEAGVWRLAVDAAGLSTWGRPDALRLVVTGPDGQSESRIEPVAGACAAAETAGPAAWLAGPWPNPGNPTIRASFRLSREGWTRVAVHDLAGRRVAVLVEGMLPAGDHEVRWDGGSGGAETAAGSYLLSVENSGSRLVRKLVLLK